MKKKIEIILKEIVKDLTNEPIKIDINTPKDINHGDYTTNLAFILAKKLGKNTSEIAEIVIKKFKEKKSSKGIEKIEFLGGFINFWIFKNQLLNSVKNLVKNPENAGKSEVFKNKKVMVEFTDPNPFKELHIGHVYSNTIGESISRIFESQGCDVWRVNYEGDVGLHVAKAVYGTLNFKKEFKEIENKSTEQRAEFLGKCYAYGALKYEEDENIKKEIVEINKEVYAIVVNKEAVDNDLKTIYEKGKKWSLEYFEDIYKILGTKFDHYYFESVAGPIGLDLVNKHFKDGVFQKSEEAVIFKGESYGLHTRVFVNSYGIPTYEAKELGLAITKYKDFKYDLSVIITGNEINEYFKVLLKALYIIKPDLAEKTKHISHGMVKLSTGKKMSSRTGNVITAESILNEAKNLAKKKIVEVKENREFENKEIDEVSQIIAVGAIKYAFLKTSIGHDVDFSFEQSISFDGNSGPYLQYAYTRTQSILEKGEVMQGQLFEKLVLDENIDPEELIIFRKLYHFSEIVESAASALSPNILCEYLFDLASSFNLFYQKKRIINAENSSKRALRLLVTKAAGVVLKQGLGFLGIVAPKKM